MCDLKSLLMIWDFKTQKIYSCNFMCYASFFGMILLGFALCFLSLAFYLLQGSHIFWFGYNVSFMWYFHVMCCMCNYNIIIGANIRTLDNVLKALFALAQVKGKDYHIKIAITLILQVYTYVSMFCGVFVIVVRASPPCSICKPTH